MNTTQAAEPTANVRQSRRQDRFALLFDGHAWTPLSSMQGGGVLAVEGSVHGRPTIAFCTDETVRGGALGLHGTQVILEAYSRAMVRDCACLLYTSPSPRD